MPLYLGNTPIGGVKTSILGDSVLYTEQNLTEEQKAQARENIGAIGENEVDTSISGVTADKDGLMLATDKVKLDNIAQGAEANVQPDLFENDTTSDAYVRNRIFGYYNETRTNIFPLTTLPKDGAANSWIYEYNLVFDYTNKTNQDIYIVTFDNIEYICPIQFSNGTYYLGGLDKYPFRLYAHVTETDCYQISVSDASIDHTLQIDRLEQVPVKLTSDWIESATANSHSYAHSIYGSDPITPASIGAAAETHATQHGTDGADPITPNMIGAASTANAEAWVFTLEDGSTVTKEVILK